MVFPSVPVYLDPPSWNQQQAQHPGSSGGGGGGGGGGEFHHLPPGAALPIRPASTADRARLAKVPQPEQPLKCPRCDSANTKFCYFNNYSLSQPRHFCKTCRRYWTRGGALRNVPVGGGCRRNKRSKAGGGSSSSKPQPTTAADRPSSSSTGAIAAAISAPPQLPFMGCLQTIPEYTGLNMGFNFQGMQPVEAGEFDRYQVGGSSSVGLDQWRIQQIQQFPFLGGLEAGGQAPVQGLYPFDGEGFLGQVHGKGSSAGLITQMASVKMEDNSQGLNMARQYLGGSRNDQFWGGSSGGGGSNGGSNGGGWMTDLSGFNSSSSNNLM